MTNLLVFPMVLPILAGALLVFFRSYKRIQQIITCLTLVTVLVISSYLLQQVQQEGILRLDFGGWLPPYGILFVGDSFALILVTTTAFVSLLIAFYAFASVTPLFDQNFFYPFFLFLLAGVNGSFLTGDLFNLFVCFEVMLLASYALIALGGRKVQLVESLKYVSINVLSSWFFLVGIAYLYRMVGTLNMAHLAHRIAEAGQTPLLTVVALLFLLVFSLKAGLFLYFWLPGSYSVPITAAGALFGALLTKVGMYALLRTFSLLFLHEPGVTHTIIGVMAAITMIGGSLGAIAYKDIRLIAAYNVVITIGFVLVALAISNELAFEGAIFYLVHDMITKALLFLLIGTMIYLTGESSIDRMSGLIRNYPMLGWLFFIAMISLAGIPPLSGFLGKVMIALGAIHAEAYWLLGIAILSSLFVLYSLLRIFMNTFWGETIISEEEEVPLKRAMLMPLVGLGIATLAVGVGAEWLTPYVIDAATTLANPQIYMDAVLNTN